MTNNTKIQSYSFTDNGKAEIIKNKLGTNWPVVYLIHNQNDIYIGETTSLERRFVQHKKDDKKQDLKDIEVIYDGEFNKSSTLDIEQNLIRLFSSDNKFNVINVNSGQSVSHNYYQREKYHNKIPFIWNELQKRNLANRNYLNLLNSELYQYSPYISLTNEQLQVSYLVLDGIINSLNNNTEYSAIINGGAGTGKTILAINLIFNLVNTYKDNIDFSDLSIEDLSFEEKIIRKIMEYNELHGKIDLAFVVPMESLRKTLNTVFKKHNKKLNNVKAISPNGVIDKKFDVIIVDEIHRLCKRKNIVNYNNFDKTSKKLGFDPMTCNQLDWIVKQSKTRILFYDENQTIKPADITNEELKKSLSKTNPYNYFLKSQMRSKGGETFEIYLKEILSNKVVTNKPIFDDFELLYFDSIVDLVEQIKEKDRLYKLSRLTAGFSWKWISKKYKFREDIIKDNKQDIEIEGEKYIWNMSNIEFTLRSESVNEIGCIHTTQGYDLNYIGVIFGKEIDYDFSKNEIIIYKSKFYDINVKKTASYNDLKKYIINAYHTMMMRGIKGCYIYAYNDNMKKYLSKFFSKYKK